jgi:hypothetical protein
MLFFVAVFEDQILRFPSCSNRAQVPSSSQRLNRSWQVCQGPYRSGTSRHGAPVRSRHKIPSITSR